MEFTALGFALGWIIAGLHTRYEDRKVAKLDYDDIIHGLIEVKDGFNKQKIFYIDVSNIKPAIGKKILCLLKEELDKHGRGK